MGRIYFFVRRRMSPDAPGRHQFVFIFAYVIILPHLGKSNWRKIRCLVKILCNRLIKVHKMNDFRH